VYFPGQGIIVWGQKTSAAASSALDRVNVVRLLCYLRKALREGAFPFTFEPNDAITRANLKAAADDILNNILSLRGIYEFATKCDESNNTPTRIDNGEMWLDVAIKPTKAAEFIYIPINVVSTGDNITGN
jgi:phage tail sheath protein FI